MHRILLLGSQPGYLLVLWASRAGQNYQGTACWRNPTSAAAGAQTELLIVAQLSSCMHDTKAAVATTHFHTCSFSTSTAAFRSLCLQPSGAEVAAFIPSTLILVLATHAAAALMCFVHLMMCPGVCRTKALAWAPAMALSSSRTGDAPQLRCSISTCAGGAASCSLWAVVV